MMPASQRKRVHARVRPATAMGGIKYSDAYPLSNVSVVRGGWLPLILKIMSLGLCKSDKSSSRNLRDIIFILQAKESLWPGTAVRPTDHTQ